MTVANYLKKILSEKQIKFLKTAAYSPCFLFDFLICFWHGIHWQWDYRFYGLPFIQTRKRGSIRIGKRFIAVSSNSKNSLGVTQPVILKTLRDEATISIGDDVGISGCTISASNRITIGNQVLIGTGVIITDSDAHAINPENRRYGGVAKTEPVVIEDNVFIGARAIILKGNTIGAGSVVGAGSIVTHDVPPYTIVAGNPARVIGDKRKLTESNSLKITNSHYE